jgi:hypothetical protein
MDGRRFDSLMLFLSRQSSRRNLGALLSGLATAASATIIERSGAAAKKKRHHKKKRGQSPPPSPPPPPPTCATLPDDTNCDGGRCLGGVCNPTPTCAESGTACTAPAAAACCSGSCHPVDFVCDRARAGGVCLSDGDCDSGVCVGYRCVDTGCLFNNDFCPFGLGTCHSTGFCLKPLGGGGPRCGSDTGASGLCNCTSHQQCVAALGAGAFCAVDTGPHCACSDGPTFCVALH